MWETHRNMDNKYYQNNDSSFFLINTKHFINWLIKFGGELNQCALHIDLLTLKHWANHLCPGCKAPMGLRGKRTLNTTEIVQ